MLVDWLEITSLFSRNSIFENVSFLNSICAIDVDSDSDSDIVIATQLPDQIQWLENDGNQVFSSHVVDAEALELEEIVAANLDNEGSVEIVSASHLNRVTVYTNMKYKQSI